MTSSNTDYNVHVYRKICFSFSGINAISPEAAAEIAAAKSTDEAVTIEEGDSIAALVDVRGDTEYKKSRWIDFEPARLQKAAQVFLDALLNVKRLAEKSGDHEAEPFTLLDLIADEVHAALAKSKGGAI